MYGFFLYKRDMDWSKHLLKLFFFCEKKSYKLCFAIATGLKENVYHVELTNDMLLLTTNILISTFQELDESESERFFTQTLPDIIRLALQLPEIIPSAIPLLKRNQNKSISLSQKQIACLLANAFLCTFPRRNEYNRSTSEYSSYPSINFSSLYRTAGDQNIEKIKCICNYFRRVCSKSKFQMHVILQLKLKSHQFFFHNFQFEQCRRVF